MIKDLICKASRTDGKGEVIGCLVQMADGTFIIPQNEYNTFTEPEFHSSGMGCGLEDRNIQDRYEAMAHGWERCIERVYENLPVFTEVFTDTVCPLLYRGDKELHFHSDVYKHKYYEDSLVRIYFSQEYLAVMGVVYDENGEYDRITIIPKDLELLMTKVCTS